MNVEIGWSEDLSCCTVLDVLKSFVHTQGDVMERELHKSSKVVMTFAGVTGTAAGQRKKSAQSAQDIG